MPLVDGVLVSKSVILDGTTLSAGSIPESLNFFSLDAEEEGDQVTVEVETTLLRWLFNDPRFRWVVLHEMGFPETCALYLEQKQPALPPDSRGVPGDVDVLLVPEDPYEAIAIEAKRFKVVIENDHDQGGARPTAKLKRAVEQVRGLADLGFHKVLLMLLVPTDGRGSTAMNSLCVGPEGRTLMRLADQARDHGLPEEAGILLVTIVQPTSKDFRASVKVGACLVREAKPRLQDPQLTERLVNARAQGW